VLIYFGGAHFFGGSMISILGSGDLGHSFFTSGGFGHSFFTSGGFGHSCFGGFGHSCFGGSIDAFFAAQDCFSCVGGGGGGGGGGGVGQASFAGGGQASFAGGGQASMTGGQALVGGGHVGFSALHPPPPPPQLRPNSRARSMAF